MNEKQKRFRVGKTRKGEAEVYLSRGEGKKEGENGFCKKKSLDYWSSTGNEICNIAGCVKPSWERGLCSMHYARIKNHGHPDLVLSKGFPARTLEQSISLFNSKLLKLQNGCLEWNGYKDRCGYGFTYHANKRIGVHRFSYEIHFGEIPIGLCVLHKCDNPPCCNPDHLFLGTPADNAIDRDKKLRGKNVFERGVTKLKPEDIPTIRKLAMNGMKTGKIAKMFGVRPETISSIKSGKSFSKF